VQRQRYDTWVRCVVTHADRHAVDEVAERLGFNRSEALRRALRIGIRQLAKVDLPGSKSEVPRDES
jgi:hypothetical protein